MKNIIVFILIIFVSSLSSIVFWFSFQESLQEETQWYDKADMFEDYSDTSFAGNIYTSSYDMVKWMEMQTKKDSFEYTVDYMNTYYDSCSVSEDDLYNIYSISNPAAVYIQSWLDWRYQLDIEREDFIDSCINVVSCVSDQDMSYLEDNYTPDTRDLCIDTIAWVMSNAEKSMLSLEWLELQNFWWDRFMNGSLDDSPYDLLVDIKNIWDALFEDNEEPEEVFFYEIWWWNWWSTWSGWPSSSTTWASSWAWWTSWWWTSWWWSTWETSTWSWEDNWWTWEENWWTWENWAIWEENWGTETWSWENWDTWEESWGTEAWSWEDNWWAPSTSESSSSPINNFICDETWELLTEEEMNESQNENLESIASSINEWNQSMASALPQLVWTDWIDWDDWASWTSWWTTSSGMPTSFDPDDMDSSMDTFADNVFWDSADNVEFDEFIATAGWMSFTECSASWDTDSIFWIRVCMIFTETTWVVDQKVINATEEAIDEINNVLLKLKRSWAIMKHKKTDEMWEIWLQDIDFWEIFSFDLVLRTKPIFPWYWSYKDEVRIAMFEENNRSMEESILWMHSSQDLEAEKNKYLVRANPARMNATSSPSWSVSNRQTNIDYANLRADSLTIDYEDIPDNMSDSDRYKSMDIFHWFLEFNMSYWEQKNSTLWSIEDISRWFKERVVTWGW